MKVVTILLLLLVITIPPAFGAIAEKTGLKFSFPIKTFQTIQIPEKLKWQENKLGVVLALLAVQKVSFDET